MDELVNFSFPTQVTFGVGAVGKLPDLLQEIGCRKPLLITDPGLVKTNAYKNTVAALTQGGVAFSTFSVVHPNPLENDVSASVELLKKDNCDAVIGFGGGSSLDTMKVAMVLVAHGGKVADFNAMEGGSAKIVKDMVPATSSSQPRQVLAVMSGAARLLPSLV